VTGLRDMRAPSSRGAQRLTPFKWAISEIGLSSMPSKRASEFVGTKLSWARNRGPFSVVTRPEATGEWQVVETHATLEDAYDAYHRVLGKTRNTPGRVVDKNGNGILGSSGSVPIPRQQVPRLMFGLARASRRDRRQRDDSPPNGG
jgi:hypothetical protein